MFRKQRNVDAADALHDPCSLSLHQYLDRLATAVDDRRVLLVEGYAEAPYTPVSRDRSVSQVQAEHVAIDRWWERRESRV